jgi:hypothetical protein
MYKGFQVRVGSKAMVYHGSAAMTSGGITRKGLVMTKKGRIVSRKKQAAGKKAIKRLFALGYKPTKGKFSLMRKSGKSKKMSRRTRKKGGANYGAMDNFADVSGAQPNPIQAAMDAMKGM